jgi:orotate phosphoribosyltransferase
MNTDVFLRELKAFVYSCTTPLPIGRDGRIRVNHFLDLLSAAHRPGMLDYLGDLFARWLAQDDLVTSVDAIAAPKRGNALLAHNVAGRLGKRSGFVKENVLFGQWTEGEIRSGDRVLLIDDIASDGELLAEAVIALQHSGIFVSNAAVLVSRVEGDAARRLRAIDVRLHAAVELSDGDLAALLA